MKYFKILTILLFSSVISFYACNENTKAAKQETLKPLEVLDPTTPPNTTTLKPANLETPQNARGVWHYICSKGCSGGAGSAINCNTCGSLLAHNSAYHNNANSTPTSSAPFANPPTAEPSRNSAGIWHYTCGKGCIGGSGSAGACATCAGSLTHNTAYHQ